MNKGASFGRRDFFKGACVAGFMVATAKLPAVAGGMFEVGKRGAHSRLATSYAVVDIGLEKPFSVLHISDTHLADAYPDEHPDKVAAAARRTTGFGARQEEALAESLEWARHNVDYVIHTSSTRAISSISSRAPTSISCANTGAMPCSAPWATTSSTPT